MRRLALLGVLMLALFGVSFQRPAYAQATWCYTFDFRDDDGGFTVVTDAGGTHVGGSGWETAYFIGTDTNDYRAVDIERSVSTTITSVELNVNLVAQGSPIYPANWIAIGYNGGQLQGSGGTPGTADVYTLNWSGSQVVTSVYLFAGAGFYNGPGDSDPGGDAFIRDATYMGEGTNPFGDDNCSPGGSGITRPLAAADVHSDWGIFDYDAAHAINGTFGEGKEVEAFSNVFGAGVAAVADGTVTSVLPWTSDDCNSVSVSLTFCYVAIPGVFTGSGFSQGYILDMVGNWQITVADALDPTIIYIYIVHAPTVEVGDVVAAGCIIGQTIQLKQWPLAALSVAATLLGGTVTGSLGFISEPTDAGVALIQMQVSGDIASLYPTLTEEPNLAACQEAQLSACVNNNPELTSFSYYTHETDVTLLDGGGVTIPSFNYIFQDQIMIDPDTDYMVSVQARKRETGDDTDVSTMNIQLGNELESFEVTGADHNYTFTPTGDDWHEDNLTTVLVSNQPSSVAPIEVIYICLAPITASTAPGSCYFANSEFDADGSGWDISATTFGTGQAFMRDGATLAQTVTLKPDDEVTPHTYTVRAVARLLATGSYTGQIGKSVTLNYEYPALTDGEVGTIDSTLVAEQGTNIVSGNVEYDYPYTLETTIEVSEDTESTFTFRVEVTDSDNYIQGLRIDSVCIDPTGDGTFPGQTGGGGFTPPFIVGCSVVPNPTENSIGPWIFYHWANLRRFFTCDLMKLLNKWFNLFDQFRITVLKVMRYWIAAVHHVAKWATSFLWWLNGHFGNIAQGQVTTITEAGGCHDIFCAIVDVTTTLGNLLTPIVAALNNVVNVLVGVFIGVVNLFFTLIGGLVAFVVALIIKLMNFIGIAVGLLIGIVGAYNSSTPTAIPGLPSCAIDPSSSPLCYMVWVSDNTIFSGRWGTLFTIILSIWAIHLILYTVREIKGIVMQTWSSS